MKKLWSKSWKSSTQKRKQRKYSFNAPLHIKHRFCNSALSKELKEKYSRRSIPVRVGDFVEVKSGQFSGKGGKVTKVLLSRVKVHVEGAVIKRADNSESFYPIHPSNVMITKLNLEDKLREAKLNKKSSSKKEETK